MIRRSLIISALVAAMIAAAACAQAQTAAVSGYCDLGAAQASTSGLKSSNYLQGIIPQCTVTVYLTGTITPATIYKDTSYTALGNPFAANADGSWLFFAATSSAYDVVLSGGFAPNIYPGPVTLTGLGVNGTSISPPADLQTAINLAGANSDISLTCGTFNVPASLTISNNNVHLHGASRDCTYVNFAANTFGLTVSGTGVRLDNVTWEGQTRNYTIKVTSAATGFRLADSAITQAGQGAGSTTFPYTPLWLQAALNDAVVERNNFYGNGPTPAAPGNAKGYSILTSGQAAGFLSNIRILNNRIWNNNNAEGIGTFDCSGTSANNGCQIIGNNVDQNDVWDGAEGSGYGIQSYSEGYSLTTTALSRTANVVTIVTATQQPGEPWTPGETVMLTGYLFGTNGSSFDGIFTLLSASGGGPYTLTWAQTAPDDTVTGIGLGGTIQPPLQHTIIANNIVRNTAGGCIYMQGLNDVTVTGNEVSNCDLTIVPAALTHGGITIGGMWRGAITGNSVDTVGHSSAYYLAHTYGVAVSGNVGVNAHLDGLRQSDSYDLAATGNTLAENLDGGIVGPSTTRINCFHCTYSNNDIYMATNTDGYHFDGLDQYDNVTGGSVHGPASGTSNAAVYATAPTSDISVTALEGDCYADGGTVKAINFGIRAAGTRITMRTNHITGCNVDGILDVGINDDIEQNAITASTTGVLASGSTGLTLLDNWLVGNTTAKTTAGAVNLIDSANIVTIGTLPVYNGSAIQVNGNTLLSSTQTGIQGTGIHVATANGSFTFHHLRQTDSAGAEADTPVDSTTVVQRVINCNTAASCSNSQPANAWFVEGGPIAMAVGTITITGISPAFTSNVSYTCRAWDVTTPANTVSCALVSGSSITITGTGTDSVTYLLIGN